MGRMHSHGKGMSASALPYKCSPPAWLKTTSPDVEDNICKFAKKGLTPSQIGVILRDSHGIAQVKTVLVARSFVSSRLTFMLNTPKTYTVEQIDEVRNIWAEFTLNFKPKRNGG